MKKAPEQKPTQPTKATTTKALASTKHAHLARHRPLIVLRSLVSSAVAFVPVPFVDDFLSTAARRALLRRLAELRDVDIDGAAIKVLATAPERRGQTSARWLGYVSRKFAKPLQIFRRTDELVDLLCVATLFDHYCAMHHVGFGVDVARARELRQVMSEAMSAAPVRMLEGSVRSLVALPDVRGRWRKLVARVGRVAGRGPMEPEVVGESAQVAAAERELFGYTTALVGAFDERWLALHPRDQLGE